MKLVSEVSWLKSEITPSLVSLSCFFCAFRMPFSLNHLIDYPIPANDDGVKSVQFILDSFKKVLSSDNNENVKENGEENSE